MSDDESKLKVAGRAPAATVGGMRIPEKKKGPSSTPGKSDPVEVIGLSQNNPLDTAVQMSTSPSQKTITMESAQVAHAHKPPAQVHQKTQHNHIQQPRK